MPRGRNTLWLVHFVELLSFPSILFFTVHSDGFVYHFQLFGQTVDMLSELSRREKEANIKADPVIDVFMKVRNKATVHC